MAHFSDLLFFSGILLKHQNAHISSSHLRRHNGNWTVYLEFNSNYIPVFMHMRVCLYLYCVYVCVCLARASTSLLVLFSKLITRVLEVCRCHGDGDLGECCIGAYRCSFVCSC